MSGQFQPTLTPSLGGNILEQVVAGGYQSFAYNNGYNFIVVFGANGDGQLCTGNNVTSLPTPTVISLQFNLGSIAAGSYYTLLLSTTGVAYGCGDNTVSYLVICLFFSLIFYSEL